MITFRCGLHQPSSKKFPSRAKRGREAKRSSIRKCPMQLSKAVRRRVGESEQGEGDGGYDLKMSFG